MKLLAISSALVLGLGVSMMTAPARAASVTDLGSTATTRVVQPGSMQLAQRPDRESHARPDRESHAKAKKGKKAKKAKKKKSSQLGVANEFSSQGERALKKPAKAKKPKKAKKAPKKETSIIMYRIAA